MNEAIFQYLYSFSHQSDFLDRIIIFFTEPIGMLALGIAVLYFIPYFKENKRKDGMKIFLFVFGSTLIATLFSKIFKELLQEPRPIVELTNIIPLIKESGYAFPSGHTTFFSSLAFSIYIIDRKLGIVFLILALSIGIARIMAGVHYPLDILGGFGLGIMIVFLNKLIFHKIWRKTEKI